MCGQRLCIGRIQRFSRQRLLNLLKGQIKRTTLPQAGGRCPLNTLRHQLIRNSLHQLLAVQRNSTSRPLLELDDETAKEQVSH